MLTRVWMQGDGRLCATKLDSYFDEFPEEACRAVIEVEEDDPLGRKGYRFVGLELTQWHEPSGPGPIERRTTHAISVLQKIRLMQRFGC